MAAEATAEEIRAMAYVGFDSITKQIERKQLKRGFQFNVIVVGEHISLSSTPSYIIPMRCEGTAMLT